MGLKSITLNENEVAVIWTVDYIREMRPDFTVEQAREALHDFADDYQDGEQDWATLGVINDYIAKRDGLPNSEAYWAGVKA